MLIEDFEYYSRMSNFSGKYLGLDRPGLKMQPRGWWTSFPAFEYSINSWAFRGPEYDQYVGKPVNICLGDSFTMNLGGPIEDSWPSQLAKKFDIPTLNLGMNGAGNDAIRIVYDRACKLFDVQETFVMYSYFHRRFKHPNFLHYGLIGHTELVHTDYENQVHFAQNMIVEAHEAFLPNYCYTDEEMYIIDNHPHFDYPHGEKKLWVNRDFHHMNAELNGKLAEYFYELSSTNT